MPLLIRRCTIDEPLPPVQDGEVVDEVHITAAGLDLHLQSPGDGLHQIQRLALAVVELREVPRPGVRGATYQRRATKVHHQLGLVVEHQRTTLEAWAEPC